MTAIISVGKPTVSKTISIVTRPACGMAAAPTDARIEVKLNGKTNKQTKYCFGIMGSIIGILVGVMADGEMDPFFLAEYGIRAEAGFGRKLKRMEA